MNKFKYIQESFTMKPSVSPESIRCRVAGVEELCFLDAYTHTGSNVYHTFALFLFFQEKRKEEEKNKNVSIAYRYGYQGQFAEKDDETGFNSSQKSYLGKFGLHPGGLLIRKNH